MRIVKVAWLASAATPPIRLAKALPVAGGGWNAVRTSTSATTRPHRPATIADHRMTPMPTRITASGAAARSAATTYLSPGIGTG